MKTKLLVCATICFVSAAVGAEGQVVLAPASDYTLSQNNADGGSAGDNGNVSFLLLSSFSRSSKTIKAEASGGLSIGTGVATSQIFYEFEVDSTPSTAGNTVGTWINYSVEWDGFQLILSTLGTNASVVVELVLRDITDGFNMHVEPIHALDLKTHSYKIITAGFDFNDSGLKRSTIPAVLKRGHTYRLTLRMSSTLMVIAPSGTQSTCDYMDGFTGGGNGGVRLNSLFVKLGVDEKELLRKLEGFENHRHIYLTGRGVGHNNTEAQSSPPILEDKEPVIMQTPPIIVMDGAPVSRREILPKPKP